jgi:hypothetical protein
MAKILASQSYNHIDYDPPMPVLTVGVGRPGQTVPTVTFDAILDTGADAMLIPLNMLEQAAARVIDRGSLLGVTGARQAVELYLVTFFVAELRLPGIRAVAIAAGSTPIVGRDVLNHLDLLLNGPAGTVDVLA